MSPKSPPPSGRLLFVAGLGAALALIVAGVLIAVRAARESQAPDMPACCISPAGSASASASPSSSTKSK